MSLIKMKQLKQNIEKQLATAKKTTLALHDENVRLRKLNRELNRLVKLYSNGINAIRNKIR